MKRTRFLSAWATAALAALSLTGLSPARAATIDTAPFYNTDISAMSQYGVELFGQTFKAPNSTDTVLDSFAFNLHLLNGTHPLDFRFRVMDWNGSQADGLPLYQSDTIAAETSGWYSFDTGGIVLKYGSPYVAFLEYAHDGSPGVADVEGALGNPYSGGQFVYLTHSAGFTSQGWVTGVTHDTDFVFRAQFSPAATTPEPAGLSLLLLGGSCCIRRRRSRSAAS